MPNKNILPRIEGDYAQITTIVPAITRGNCHIKGNDRISELPGHEDFIRHLDRAKLSQDQLDQVTNLLVYVDSVLGSLDNEKPTTVSGLRKILTTEPQKLQVNLKTDKEPVLLLLKLFIDGPDRYKLAQSLT